MALIAAVVSFSGMGSGDETCETAEISDQIDVSDSERPESLPLDSFDPP